MAEIYSDSDAEIYARKQVEARKALLGAAGEQRMADQAQAATRQAQIYSGTRGRGGIVGGRPDGSMAPGDEPTMPGGMDRVGMAGGANRGQTLGPLQRTHDAINHIVQNETALRQQLDEATITKVAGIILEGHQRQ
jgi:hypothetical protein